MKNLAFLSLLVLAACGRGPDVIPVDCPGQNPAGTKLKATPIPAGQVHAVAGAAPFTVETCSMSDANWTRASTILDNFGLTDPDRNKWYLFWIEGSNWDNVQGQTWPDFLSIYVTTEAPCILVHELIHVYENDVQHFNNPTHQGWGDKGYYGLINLACEQWPTNLQSNP